MYLMDFIKELKKINLKVDFNDYYIVVSNKDEAILSFKSNMISDYGPVLKLLKDREGFFDD